MARLRATISSLLIVSVSSMTSAPSARLSAQLPLWAKNRLPLHRLHLLLTVAAEPTAGSKVHWRQVKATLVGYGQFALSSWPRSASWDAYRVNGEIPRQDSSQGRSGPARSAGSSLARNQKAHGPGKPAERPVNRSGDGPRPADRSQGTAVQAVLALRSVRLWQLLLHRPYPPDRRRGRPLCGCDEADRRRRGIWP